MDEAWVAINGKNTISESEQFKEYIFDEKPIRWIDLDDGIMNWEEWSPSSDDSHYNTLPKGTIEKLLGYELTWKDDPVNLFVPKFLGTPPINVFDAVVKGEILYIGEECVLEVKGVADQEVHVGIRPEGFEVCENGALTVTVKQIEYIGRDKSIVAENPNTETDTLRFIVESDVHANENQVIKVNVKPAKCFVFDKLTEMRLQ